MSTQTSTRIGIITGSTRPGRKSETVARWVHDIAVKRGDAEFEVVDLTDSDLPHLDEPVPPLLGQYSQPHTKAWAERIASLDGFVFVTPEYNRSMPGVLKNAIDFLYAEWNDKAAGFVGYGADGGVRAVEHLRGVMGELRVADVRDQVTLGLYTDFVDFAHFQPADHQEGAVTAMLDQLVAWAGALRTLRA